MSTNSVLANLNYHGVLESLGTGLIIFDPKDKLVFDNEAARTILGPNLMLIRSEGWSAIAMLIDASANAKPNQPTAKDIKTKVQHRTEPVRFYMLLMGSYTPCWISSVTGEDNKAYLVVVIERPDWSALTELMSTFRSEARSAITSTSGHADFVRRLLLNPPKKSSVEDMGKRTVGMINLISTDMYNLQLLMDLLHRLEVIRTGQLTPIIEGSRKKTNIGDFIEDFVEELNEKGLLEPGVNLDSYRDRLVVDVDDNLYITAPRSYLNDILRDLLRNAFMYSEAPSPVTIRAVSASQGRHIEFNVIDRGFGIPAKETERVFRPFERGRQPQIMREFGYGLSLYLAKAEVEAMGGRMWFESEEGVGSTFSFKLPAAQ